MKKTFGVFLGVAESGREIKNQSANIKDLNNLQKIANVLSIRWSITWL